MSTHFKITGCEEDDDRLRSLLEPCSFCDARAGEPCRIVIVRGDKRGEYICPAEHCEQLYKQGSQALGCSIHELETTP